MKSPATETARNFRDFRARFEAQMSAYLKRLGGRLTELREKAGYTQEEAAHALSVSLRTVQNWEAGLSLPYKRNLRAAEKLYALDAGDLDEDAPVRSLTQQAQLDRIEEKLDEILEILRGDDESVDGLPAEPPTPPAPEPSAPDEGEPRTPEEARRPRAE